MKTTIAMLALVLCCAGSGDAQVPKPAPMKQAELVDRYGDPLPDGAIARLGTMRLRHGVSAGRIVYSPNGKLLASVGRFPGVCLWDADTGKCLRVLKGHTFVVTSAAFSSDGTRILSGSPDGTVRL